MIDRLLGNDWSVVVVLVLIIIPLMWANRRDRRNDL